MAIAVAMIFSVLAMPFQARGQTPTLVVNPVTVATGDGNSNAAADLTDMFVGSLLRTNVFNVIDARIGRRVDADFDLSSSCTYQEEQIEEEVVVPSKSDDDSVKVVRKIRTRVTFVRIDISVTDRPGKVFFTEFWAQDAAESSIRTAAAPAIEHLIGRLATYYDIVGLPSGAGSVEGSVVAIMDSTTAVVDKGSKAGLAVGDELEVQRGDVVTNADGIVIFSRRESIGKAKMSEVQAAGALITVAASLELEKGDVVVLAAPTPSPPSPAERVETANALYDASFYMQAARAYLAAREVDPELVDVLFPLAVAQMKTGDHDGAYESFAGFLDTGQPVELAAIHEHTFGRCRGTFVLTRELVSFRSPREDDPDHWFDVPLGAVVESRLRFEDDLVIRAPSAEQVGKNIEKNKDDSKNWTLVFNLRGENTEVARIVSRYILCSQGRCPQT